MSKTCSDCHKGLSIDVNSRIFAYGYIQCANDFLLRKTDNPACERIWERGRHK
jgi:hypothetical protein